MCPKPFYGKKIKENFFSVGKTRGPLLARAALKRAFNVFFAFFFFCLCCPYCCCFSLYRGEGIILRFFPSIIIPFGLFRRFFNALLNTSVFICRLLDTAENTMIPMIFVFMLNSSCYMMQHCDSFVYYATCYANSLEFQKLHDIHVGKCILVISWNS